MVYNQAANLNVINSLLVIVISSFPISNQCCYLKSFSAETFNHDEEGTACDNGVLSLLVGAVGLH